MKCSNPDCNHGIGLLSHRRGWVERRRYGSKQCRDRYLIGPPKRSHQERYAMTYFDWLFLQPIEKQSRN